MIERWKDGKIERKMYRWIDRKIERQADDQCQN